MILTSSFIRNLEKNYPNSKITVLIRESVKLIAESINGIDCIEILNSPWFSRKDSSGWFNAVKFLFKNYKKYDLAIDLHSDPRNIVLARCCGKYSLGYGTRGFGFLLSNEIKCIDTFVFNFAAEKYNPKICEGISSESQIFECKDHIYDIFLHINQMILQFAIIFIQLIN